MTAVGTAVVGVVGLPVQFGLDTLSGQMAATVVLLVGLAAGWLAFEAVTSRLRDRVSDIAIETTETVVFTTFVGVTAAALVAVWDAYGPIADELESVARDELLGVRIVVSVLLLATAYGLTRVVRRLVNRSRVAEVSTDHRRQVVYHVAQVTLYAVGGLLVLAVWEVDLRSLFIGAGVLGVVVGLAARETLGAVIAGFVILFARPFLVGDWVVIADREGVVEDITIVNTRLRTLDDEQVMIPNDRVASGEIVNRTREGQLRETVDVGIDYGADVREAIAVAERAMHETDAVLKSPAPKAVGKAFGDSAVVLELQFWIDDPSPRRLWRARTAVVEAVKDAYAEAGIDIPFPQRTLSPRDGVDLVADRPRPTPDGGRGDDAESGGNGR